MLGDGVSLSAEFWQYDSRLGRRWNVDPVFKEYESPYACFAGNPVWFADYDGDTVIIFNNDKVTKKYIKAYFKEHFGKHKVFGFSKSGILLVNEKRFNRFFAKSNPPQQMLLSGVKEAIVTQEKVLVKIQETNPDVHFVKRSIIGYSDDLIPIYDEGIETVIKTAALGGGGTAYSKYFGAYVLGICNQVANTTHCSTGISIPGMFVDKTIEVTTGNASSVFLHELLDEFLNFYVKHVVTNSSPPLEQVHYNNAALENLRLPERDGEDHER